MDCVINEAHGYNKRFCSVKVSEVYFDILSCDNIWVQKGVGCVAVLLQIQFMWILVYVGDSISISKEYNSNSGSET